MAVEREVREQLDALLATIDSETDPAIRARILGTLIRDFLSDIQGCFDKCAFDLRQNGWRAHDIAILMGTHPETIKRWAARYGESEGVAVDFYVRLPPLGPYVDAPSQGFRH